MSDSADVNLQSLQAHSDLQKQLGAREWHLNLRAGPDCILILAEALLVVSKREAMALDLSGPGLKYEKLYADVRNCAGVGGETFTKTGERMKKVCRLASELGGPGGLIESMVKYLDPNQSEARDRQLQRYISLSKAKSTESVNILREVKKDFEVWRELTKSILGALDKESAANVQKQQKNENRLRECELERDQNQEALEQRRQVLEYFESRTGNELRFFQSLIDNIPRTIAGAGAVLSSAATVGLSPQIVVSTCVGLSFNYLIIESMRREEKSAVQRLEREASTLRHILEELSGEALSIATVARIVRQALRRLDELQQRVDMFLKFLIKIQDMVIIADEGKELTLDPARGREERADTDIKKEILDGSYAMKMRFLFASKAAALYNDIDEQFISVGVNWLSTFRPDESSQEDIDKKLVEIEQWRRKICDRTEELAATRYTELKQSLESLPKTWEEPLRKANPGPSLGTAT